MNLAFCYPMNLAFCCPMYGSLETDGHLGQVLWVSGFLILPGIYGGAGGGAGRNPMKFTLPVDYLSGGCDLIHRLLFPEVPLARYVSWPQILMKRKQKILICGHLYFLAKSK